MCHAPFKVIQGPVIESVFHGDQKSLRAVVDVETNRYRGTEGFKEHAALHTRTEVGHMTGKVRGQGRQGQIGGTT